MDDVGPELIKNNLTLIMKKTLKLKFFIYKGLKKYNIFKVQIRYKTFEEIQF
jgi:Cys-tRNA synthase (O-phospho-L-seryl-tRNA:Cys-tRNA synthase)